GSRERSCRDDRSVATQARSECLVRWIGVMTTARGRGSILFLSVVLSGCKLAEAGASGESCLGVADKGIFCGLDPAEELHFPVGLSSDRVSAEVDRKHAVVVLAIDGFPRKVYPLGGSAALDVGKINLALRPGDRVELAPLLVEARTTE